MNRREFMKLVSISSSSSALYGLSANAKTLGGDQPDYLLFDARFQSASENLHGFSSSGKQIQVNGDVTDTWNNVLKTVVGENEVWISGITTESYYFCLSQLLDEHSDIEETAMQRYDHDLWVWSIRSKPNLSMKV